MAEAGCARPQRRRGPAQLGRDQGAASRAASAGIFGEVPENLPAPLLRAQGPAPRRVVRLRRPDAELPLDALRGGVERSRRRSATAPTRALFDEVGDLLFAAVNVARKLHVDPELALRAATDRFRDRVEAAERLAAADGERWADLDATRSSPTTPRPD